MGQELLDRIEQRPGVLGGKLVTRGTRLSVLLIAGQVAAGASEDELLGDYPHITREDIEACVAYAEAYPDVLIDDDGPFLADPSRWHVVEAGEDEASGARHGPDGP